MTAMLPLPACFARLESLFSVCVYLSQSQAFAKSTSGRLGLLSSGLICFLSLVFHLASQSFASKKDGSDGRGK